MKSDKKVNEQVDEENQTQKGGAKKGTSNAKNYTSRCTGLGLHKIFVAVPEEENGALRVTCFVPLLLIDPIATMSTSVAEIFDRHLGDMKFQFWEIIIQMKPIHVCLILGLRISLIANEFLFVDPEHMTNFRMRRFPKKKNTYGLKEIDDTLKQEKLERHQGKALIYDILRLNLLKIILSFLPPNKGKILWVNLKFPRKEESIHLFPKLQGWRMTSFKRRQIVTFKKFFANPKLLVIAMKPSEIDMQQGLVQEAMSFYVISKLPFVIIICLNISEISNRSTCNRCTDSRAPAVVAPTIGSNSSATEIRAIVVRWEAVLYQLEIFYSLGSTSSLLLRKMRNASKREGDNEKKDGKMKKAEPITKNGEGEWQKKAEEADVPNKKKKMEGPKKEAFTDDQFDHQVTPGEGLEVVNDLIVDDDVEVGREVNLTSISSKYGGDLLEMGDEKDNDDKKNVEEKVKSEEEQPQVTEEEDS
ncbi:hypothetical protein GIB67_039203 [Kingdonia uniflora]|uniref:Uncharacterized protein n=1 Tax=Kingdonia uniflora TaxID=39325 RepID=A0A7J7MM31_9MAGN|nr:hypothetical protein GIB67_039203 [Kingdonia uniflora]